jgi:large subunit ribosomal protein L21
MYAIVEVGGLQWKVSKKKILRVPKMDVEPGKVIDINNVLLVVDGKSVTIGKPLVKGAQVKAKVVSHGKDKKVIVFKKKRRKNYRVTKGHRQDYTELKIDQISVGKGESKKAAITAQKKQETKPEKESKRKGTESPQSTKAKKASQKPQTPAKKKVTTAKKSSPAKITAATNSTTKKGQTAQKPTKKSATQSTTKTADQSKKKD